jgi:mlo protein
MTGGSRHLLAGGAVTVCPEGYTTMLDAAAIHHVHILIFVIACSHITYSIILIQMSEMVVRRWTGWEHWGDDEAETLEKVKSPKKFSNGCHAAMSGLIGQFSTPVTPFKYIALRRFYLTKNKHPTSFNFADHLIDGLEKDFHELVGISWWMWFLLMAQVLAEGYGFGQYNLFAAISLFQTIGVGMYCSAVIANLATQIYTAYGGTNQGIAVSQELLDKIQSRTQNHKNILQDVEPTKVSIIIVFSFS